MCVPRILQKEKSLLFSFSFSHRRQILLVYSLRVHVYHCTSTSLLDNGWFALLFCKAQGNSGLWLLPSLSYFLCDPEHASSRHSQKLK